MRLADYVIDFLEKAGVRDIFMISGGGNMFLVDAVGRNKNINYICSHHEQACAMAAEGYARLKNNIGVVLVTTGPGGTNAITGAAGSWLDSVPVMVLSGQVKLGNTILANPPGLRQFGDQELNIVDVVKPITKYAEMVTEAKNIRYHLEKALYLAKSSRPGPVWLDIPLDIQSAEVEVSELSGFNPLTCEPGSHLDSKVDETVRRLQSSRRPLILAGNGIRLAGAHETFLELLDILEIPVVTAINGNDLVTGDYPFYTGRPGIMGQRGANFAVQNCDLLLSIGSRLMLRQVGMNYEFFAREAVKIVVDIDGAELVKKSIRPDMAICCDAGLFIKKLIEKLGKVGFKAGCDDWKRRCADWREKYNGIEPCHRKQEAFVNSYCFVERLAEYLSCDDHVITSNGTSNISTLYTLKLKKGQRLFTNTAIASMGYGLPAAIGACIANGRRQIICMENDGSIQMNIQELQTIVHHSLPVKIFVFNNDGYLSIKMTQSAFFPDNITAADPASGVSCPDLEKIAWAYGIPFTRINCATQIDDRLSRVFEHRGAFICEIMMDPWQQLLPRVVSERKDDGRLVSKPLEDMYPFLPRDEFYSNMIIKPME